MLLVKLLLLSGTALLMLGSLLGLAKAMFR
jgi:hypothetical protein